MEQNQDQSLFDMNMDGNTQSHLLSISKWTRFISVTGFIIGGLVLILFAAYGTEIVKRFSILFSFGDSEFTALIVMVVVVCLLMVCWLYFLFRASTLLRKGLQSRDTVQLADGFKAMRSYFIFSFIISVLSILSTLRSFL